MYTALIILGTTIFWFVAASVAIFIIARRTHLRGVNTNILLSRTHIDTFEFQLPLKAVMIVRKIDTEFFIRCTKMKTKAGVTVELLVSDETTDFERARIRKFFLETGLDVTERAGELVGSFLSVEEEESELWEIIYGVMSSIMHVRDNQGIWLQFENARAF